MSVSSSFQVLRLDASARRGSLSTLLADTFMDQLASSVPGLVQTRRDLGAHPVPHITEAWTELCDNVMTDGLYELDQLREAVRTEEQEQAWAVLAPYLDELVRADLVVIATPMYNYSVPSALKAWIDQVTFPRMRLGERRFVVLAARGGRYAGTEREAVDHVVTYLRDFIRGHFSVPEPAVVTVDLANSRVDPLLRPARPEHEDDLARALGEVRRVAVAVGRSRAAG